MSASAAVLDVSRPLRRERALHPAAFAEPATPIRDHRNLAVQVRSVLKQAGLSMRQISTETGMRFGKKSAYFIPQTFLYKQKTGITPHLCQVVALSEMTGHRFADWMKVFGFDLRLILALQLRIPNERTTVVTPGRQACDRYCYAKIGSRDAVVYPKLRPGSIVRADRFFCRQILESASARDHLWLVEHPAGLTCCHVNPVGNQQVVLLPNRPPLSPWPLRLPTQARILGLVDGEVCFQQAQHLAPEDRDAVPQLRPVSPNREDAMSLSRLLRRSRLRTGLTFREAHKLTQQIAGFMGNRDFGIAAGLLSDYEAMNKLPRHIAKIISLCVIYGVDISQLLEAGGIRIDDSQKRPLFKPERPGNSSLRSPSPGVNGSDQLTVVAARREASDFLSGARV